MITSQPYLCSLQYFEAIEVSADPTDETKAGKDQEVKGMQEMPLNLIQDNQPYWSKG